ncbi:MAG TPA: urease accessory UreF family protein [Burkholderiales bacterium]|nr:urease accessory UreF family protein [Burkholderiales bacterium]
MMNAVALTQLLQLASPALPVGAYTYSQGLEWAAESGAVRDEAGATAWIAGVLEASFSGLEAPVLARLTERWAAGDAAGAERWNALFLAGRESAELRAETLQMGYSMALLLRDSGMVEAERLAPLAALRDPSFPAAWGFAAAAFGLPLREAVAAYAWAWLENQVMAAVKLVPLGQTAGQRMLAALAARIPALAERAVAATEDTLTNFAPLAAIASSRHETQYTRLFRS